jgi:hypothetical protein
MSTENKQRTIKVESGLLGGLWAIGWMFTIGFAHLIWWQALIAIIIWPYYLGLVLR